MNIGWTELLLVLGIVLLLFGPSKLPGLGKSLGEAIRGFKKGMTDSDEKPAHIVREENHRLDSDEKSDSHAKATQKDKDKA